MPINLTELRIDRFAHVPMYQQLADQLRSAINDGRLRPGDEIPGEPAIADATGITRDVVARALNVLASEGLLVRRRGAMTKVATPPPVRHLTTSRYVEELHTLRAGGDHPQQSAFTIDHGIGWSAYRVDVVIAREKASSLDVQHLAIGAGEPILRRRFIKYVENEPVQIQRSALPWDIAGRTPLADPGRQPWPGGTIAELYSLGLIVTKIIEYTSARNPTDDERRDLRMETPGPVFDIIRVFWATDQKRRKQPRPVETSRVIMPAARNVLHHETIISE